MFDSALLMKQAIPGETIVVVLYKDAYNQSAFQFGDAHGRVAILHHDGKYRCHALRVPESIWNANQGAMAESFMQSGSRDRFVIRTESPNVAKIAESLPLPASATSEAQFTLDCIKATLASYAGAAITQESLQECLDRIANAVRGTVEAPAVTPTPGLDTIEKIEAEEARVNAQIEHLETFPTEKGATDTDGNAPNVVGQGEADPTVAPASETLSSQGESDSSEPHKLASGGSTPPPATTSPSEILYEAAFDKLESPMRIKALAALLGTDEATLKTALESPQSHIELGHAGWVKRK